MPAVTLEHGISSTDTVIDLLDRQPFINQMIQIADALSKNKKNACYAVNGAWGVGKTFVINEFEKQIAKYGQDDTTLNGFLVFHYDCWKYDYYAEPLTAIIAVMLETIERDVHLLPDDTKKTILATLKAVGIYALDHFDKRIDRKFGFSPKEIYEAIANNKKEVLAEIAESHEYDSYYAIKTTLLRLREAIAKLAEYQTILLVVDELDRCLPEYTIKVLERLHHIFEGIPNVQVILATDKKQLGHVVQQIYGDETSVEKYLEKFIQFELSLSTSTINDAFTDRFSEYSNRFESSIKEISPSDVDAFRRTIFEGVDIRVQISLIERCLLVHDLLVNHDEKMDHSIMCMELFFTLLRYYNYSNGHLDNSVYITPNLTTTYTANKSFPNNMQGLELLGKYYQENNKWMMVKENRFTYILLGNSSHLLFSFILGAYRHICGEKHDSWYDDYNQMSKYKEYSNKFWNLLKIIH